MCRSGTRRPYPRQIGEWSAALRRSWADPLPAKPKEASPAGSGTGGVRNLPDRQSANTLTPLAARKSDDLSTLRRPLAAIPARPTARPVRVVRLGQGRSGARLCVARDSWHPGPVQNDGSGAVPCRALANGCHSTPSRPSRGIRGATERAGKRSSGAWVVHQFESSPYPRTPAMAAGLADHIWTCEEIAALLD